jgi:hypothetical protein
MRKTLALLFLSLFASMRSQVTLTNAQVFNYSVGDTIQFEIVHAWCPTKPTLYNQWVILQKTSIPNQITYILEEKRRDNCNGCLGSYGNYSLTNTLVISNADSLAKYVEAYNTSPCIPYGLYTESVFTDPNGKLTNLRTFQTNTMNPSCTPQNGSNARLTAGVGESYYLSVQNGDPCFFSKDFNYYHKIGENPVGTSTKFTVGLKEVKPQENEITIFPNPTSDGNFGIENPAKDVLNIRILSVTGQELFAISSEENIIFIKPQLPPALYVISIHRASGENLIKKLIIK